MLYPIQASSFVSIVLYLIQESWLRTDNSKSYILSKFNFFCKSEKGKLNLFDRNELNLNENEKNIWNFAKLN